jgi:hypothetical protein
MRVSIPGHRYHLKNFEDSDQHQVLSFINKKPTGEEDGQMMTEHDGTSTEEVIEMLLDRMNFLQKAFPCRENAIVITKLDEALLWLNKRTADREKRNVEGKALA